MLCEGPHEGSVFEAHITCVDRLLTVLFRGEPGPTRPRQCFKTTGTRIESYQTTCPKQQYEWEKTIFQKTTLRLFAGIYSSVSSFAWGAIQGRSAEPDEAGAVNESSVDVGTEFLIKPAANLINPTFKVEAKQPRVNWTGVLTQSLEFLAVDMLFD